MMNINEDIIKKAFESSPDAYSQLYKIIELRHYEKKDFPSWKEAIEMMKTFFFTDAWLESSNMKKERIVYGKINNRTGKRNQNLTDILLDDDFDTFFIFLRDNYNEMLIAKKLDEYHKECFKDIQKRMSCMIPVPASEFKEADDRYRVMEKALKESLTKAI